MRLIRAWRRLLLALAGPDRTLLLAVDDIQWADELTVGVISHILESSDVPRVLVLTTRRSDLPPRCR